MFSIRNSPYSDCISCDLLHEKSCIYVTNSPDDLSKIDFLAISENPGKDEVKIGEPLIGRAGKTFRVPFEEFGLSKFRYLLTNIVWCQTLDRETNRTINPTDETISICKFNAFNLIKICKPKIILCMGTSPAKAFGIIDKGGITSMRGEIYEWEGFKVFLTVHPSFVNRNKSFKQIFEEDIKSVGDILRNKKSKRKIVSKSKLDSNKQPFYKIPKKFYSENYRLVDVHNIRTTNEMLYIFRDKDNKKVYHKEVFPYYYYEVKSSEDKNKLVLPLNKVNKKILPLRNRFDVYREKVFEGDINPETKHSIDYYHNSKGEVEIKNINVMFLDIETYVDKGKDFPFAEDANYPITAITFRYHNETITHYLNDGRKTEYDNDNRVIPHKNEKSLVISALMDIKSLDPDIIAGWYLPYDVGYIFNRLPKIGMNSNDLSSFGYSYIDLDRKTLKIAGITCLDMLEIYKRYTEGERENYKLDTISRLEIGEGKTENIDPSELYRKDLTKFIKYNRQDVDLLNKIENKMGQISLLFEFKNICHCTLEDSIRKGTQVDALVLGFFKNRGLVVKNSNKDIVSKDKFKGAYVKPPIVGLHEYIADLDYTSLYPSCIATYNIGPNVIEFKFKDRRYGYDFIYNPENIPDEVEIIDNPVEKPEKMITNKNEILKRFNDEKLICTVNGCFYRNHDVEKSYYLELLLHLMDTRKIYKDKMLEAEENKNENIASFFNQKQLAYKILANAIYGVQGNKSFRLYSLDLASSVTLSGQEFIKTTIRESENILEFGKSSGKKTLIGREETYSDVLDNETDFKHVITSDTDSVFIKLDKFTNDYNTLDSKINKMNEVCETVSDYMNKDIIPKIVESRGVDIDKYNKMEIKNELIIKKGLFLTKKHYCIHTIRKEGKIVDKLIPMGIEVKKSDYPRYTKECMMTLLDMIVKSDDFNLMKVLEFVDRKTKEFERRIREGDISIARPTSFNKKIEDYKVYTPGVRGMLFWNRFEYDIFRSGSKGYLFRLKGIDLDCAPNNVLDKIEKGDKIDAITIPIEEGKLPDYYIPNSQEILRFAWIDRYKSLLSPLIDLRRATLTL